MCSTATSAGYGKTAAQEGNKLGIEFEHAGLKKTVGFVRFRGVRSRTLKNVSRTIVLTAEFS